MCATACCPSPQIRRIADIYEWGNKVLWPGLLGNTGPFCGDVGLPGFFRSASSDGNSSTDFKGGCNDDNGKGYPYLMNRVFIQHSLNLFFVGASRRARAPS